MDNFVDERDFKILENDKCTFFVLRRIIKEKCELLLTDHERLVICFSDKLCPVWIWTPDDASKEEMERAYQIASEHSFLNGGHRFNLKHNLAKFFIERTAADGKTLSIFVNMLAYDCQDLVEPARTADGSIHQCGSGDIDELADFINLFYKEVKTGQKDCGDYRADAEAFINTGNMFFWKDGQGNNVASCKFTPAGNMASIQLVFTRPGFRRKHYAENLVYQVTKIVMDAGYIPMLYTDADYTASNACYGKIGYVLRGRLCTIG